MRKLCVVIVLLLVVGVSVAQEDEVVITSTTLWHIDEELCPPDDHCGSMWRLSPSGEKLFVYFTANYQLYTIDMDDQIKQYDLSPYPNLGIGSWLFDYVPYSEDSVLVYNGYNFKLMKYDLTTQTVSDYLASDSFLPCNADRLPPTQYIVRPSSSNWLSVCGQSPNNRNISVIDLTTDTRYEIDTFGAATSPKIYIQPWLRVYVGYDGTAYVYFQDYILQSFFSDYVHSPDILTVAKRSPNDSSWSRIDISLNQMPELGSIGHLGRLAGVDANGNLYFYNFISSGTSPRFTKINPQGDFVWFLTPEMLNGDPYIIDITPDGKLIMVDGPNDSTIGAEISMFEVTMR